MVPPAAVQNSTRLPYEGDGTLFRQNFIQITIDASEIQGKMHNFEVQRRCIQSPYANGYEC